MGWEQQLITAAMRTPALLSFKIFRLNSLERKITKANPAILTRLHILIEKGSRLNILLDVF